MDKDRKRRPNIREIVDILERIKCSVGEDGFVLCSLTKSFVVAYVFFVLMCRVSPRSFFFRTHFPFLSVIER
jgi:hypothetical protein